MVMLYQQLNINLDLQCQVCKKNFDNTFQYFIHIKACKEQIKCSICGKSFGHHQILQLHMKFHSMSQPEQNQQRLDCGGQLIGYGILSQSETHSDNYDEPINGLDDKKNQDTWDKSSVDLSQTTQTNIQTQEVIKSRTIANEGQACIKNRSKPNSAKKKIGLTKIKMEDCLRCDECSCIYIDKDDYYKHMRNFHHLDGNNRPILKQSGSRKRCRSCCKQCRGGRGVCSPIKRVRASRPGSNLIFKINMRDNIKDRWTKMVSQHLDASYRLESAEEHIKVKAEPTVKLEPDDSIDVSHLLSQVEVKIKTEPAEDYYCN